MSHLLLPPLLSLLVVSGVLASCPAGWKEFNSFCYWRSSYATPWAFADEDCSLEEASARLASIHSFVESAWVMETYDYADTWIGLNDIRLEGDFEWVDGSKVNYTFWGPGEPDDLNGQDCVHMPYLSEDPHNGHWDDIGCEYERHFLCKMPMQ